MSLSTSYYYILFYYYNTIPKPPGLRPLSPYPEGAGRSRKREQAEPPPPNVRARWGCVVWGNYEVCPPAADIPLRQLWARNRTERDAVKGKQAVPNGCAQRTDQHRP